jgi:hypothetical protein
MATSCHHLFRCNNSIEKMTAHGHCFFFNYNTTTEKDDDTLSSSSSFQTQRRKNTQENNKKNQKKGGSLLSSSHFALSLLALAFAFPFLHFCFKCFFLASFFSQVGKKKRHKGKKTIEKKKYVEKGGSLPSSSCSTFSLLAPALAFSLLHFCFKCFLLAFFSFCLKREKKHKEKNHREEKICREGREPTFKLPFCPLNFGFHFCPPIFALLFQAFSLSIFLFSSRRKEKKTQRKKP